MAKRKKKKIKKRHKMRAGGGAKKGSAFERKMARRLSVWWYGGKEGYLWRRPGPGTRFFKKDKHRHSGDIVPSVDRTLPVRWPFHVELKCFSKKRLKLDYLLWPNKSPIRKIWKKAIEECRKDLIPMLILKANLAPEVCVIRVNDLDKIAGVIDYAHHDMHVPIGITNTWVTYEELDQEHDVLVFPWTDLEMMKRVKGKKI